jgi:integrase
MPAQRTKARRTSRSVPTQAARQGGERPGNGRPRKGTVLEWVRKSGDRGFALRFLDQNDERQYERCGFESEGWTRELAELQLADFLEQVRTGTYVPTPDARDASDDAPADPLFGPFAREVLAKHRVEVEDTTAAFNENMLENHLMWFFAHLRLSEITYEKIEEFKQARLHRMRYLRRAAANGTPVLGPNNRAVTLSETTINHSIEVLGLLLQKAVRRRGIALAVNEARDPSLRVAVPKRTVRDWLEADEFMLLLEAAARIDSPVKPTTLHKAAEVRRLRDECGLSVKQTARRLGISEGGACYLYERRPVAFVSQRRTIIALLGASGVRNTEACLLRPMDLDFAHNKIRVHKSKTRAGMREIDMTPWLRRQLEEYLESLSPDYPRDAPLFPTRSGAFRTKDNLNQRVLRPVHREALKLCQERGLAPLTVTLTAHDFRRTYVTMMFEAGAPLSYVKEQVGHAHSRTTTEIYDRLLFRRDRVHLGRAFDELMTGAVPTEPSRYATGSEPPPGDDSALPTSSTDPDDPVLCPDRGVEHYAVA